MPKDTGNASDPTYTEAVTRLEEILTQIEEGEVDIDALSGLVAEAAEMVTLCRHKITAAEMQVKEVTERLEREAAGTTPAEEEPVSGEKTEIPF